MTDTLNTNGSTEEIEKGSPRSLPPPSPSSPTPRPRRTSAPDVPHPLENNPSLSTAATAQNEAVCSQRVFKKSSPNNKVTLYLSSRDLVISEQRVDKLRGVLLVDPEYVTGHKVFGQVTLTFRYGREDEEVMGLRFCNEAVMSLNRLYPGPADQEITPLQEALVKRLGQNAYPFSLEVTPLAPPSVQLVPAKQYRGAPIGTSYDVRAFVADRADEKPARRGTVRMGIRVLQRCPCQQKEQRGSPARASVDRPFLLSEGRVRLEAALDRASYKQGEPVHVRVTVHNRSAKTVRRIKILVVQHVDVCMFSNGKFKNVVALINSRQDCPISPGVSTRHSYSLYPTKGATKNWIALEDSYTRVGASTSLLAATVARGEGPPNNEQQRNVFAIYVTYYVKVKLLVGAMSTEVSVKLPFHLLPSEETDTNETHKTLDLDVARADVSASASSDKPEVTGKGDAESAVKVERTDNGEHCSVSKVDAGEIRPRKIGATAVCADTIETPDETQC